MKVKMEELLEWYWEQLDVRLERVDHRHPQAHFGPGKVARLFIPKPIAGGEETATKISFIEKFLPETILGQLPIEAAVKICGFVRPRTLDLRLKEDASSAIFHAVICE